MPESLRTAVERLLRHYPKTEAERDAALSRAAAAEARVAEAERHVRNLAARLERMRDGWHDEDDELRDLEAARAFLAAAPAAPPEPTCDCGHGAKSHNGDDSSRACEVCDCGSYHRRRGCAPEPPPLPAEVQRVVEAALAWGAIDHRWKHAAVTDEDVTALAEKERAAQNALSEAVAALRAARTPSLPKTPTSTEEALRLHRRGLRTDEEAAVACSECGGEGRGRGGEWSVCQRCKGVLVDPDAPNEAVAAANEVAARRDAALRASREKGGSGG